MSFIAIATDAFVVLVADIWLQSNFNVVRI